MVKRPFFSRYLESEKAAELAASGADRAGAPATPKYPSDADDPVLQTLKWPSDTDEPKGL
jgi:hypothetical protein